MKKFVSIVLALTMILSMATVAFAEEVSYDDMSTVTVTKTYNATNTGTTSPAETFTFSTLTCTGVEDAGVGVTAENAPVPTIASVSYSAGEAGSETASKDIIITLPTYTAVGVYTYTFSENVGDTAGVTYYNDDITLVVTVIEQNGKVRVAAVHTEGEDEAKSDDFANVYSAGSLSVSKTVTGQFGDLQKDFNVKVTFTAPTGMTVREAITYVEDGETKTIAAGWNTTAEANIDLKNGETVTFTNIPYGVTYTVVEDDYTGEGYDAATYNFSDNTNKKIDSAADTVGITNNKGGDVDTGISMDTIPYIVVLAVAVFGLVAVVANKRRAAEF